MMFYQPMKKIAPFMAASLLLIFSCMKLVQKSSFVTIKEDPANAIKMAKEIREKTPAKVGDGLELTLWASDSLAPDPVAMSIDDWEIGRASCRERVLQVV